MSLEQVIQVALLGTERQPLPTFSPDTPLGRLQQQCDPAQRESALLGVAALAFGHQQAGQLPWDDAGPVPSVCRPETLRCATVRAGSLLARLLAGEHPALLGEWLRLSTGQSRIALPEQLAALLTLGSRQAALRETILPVVGERGRWLAAQNADWNWILGSTADDSVWETGESAARALFLRRLRESDPVHALELLTQTWKQESPEDRAVFIAVLSVGLNPADEPFLEAALDDKRKEVRRTAAALLSRLPDSALARRMMARLQPLLKWVSAEAGSLLKLRKAKPAVLEVVLPEACDKAMQRDGIEPKPPAGFGEKAGWLIQLLEATPLTFWTNAWRQTPAEILAASEAGEWKKELLEGWTRAALRQQDTVWCEEITSVSLEAAKLAALRELFGALDGSRRERLIGRLDAGSLPVGEQPLFWMLLAFARHDWSPAFSHSVLAAMRRMVTQPAGDWTIRNTFKEFAVCLHPEAFAAALGAWPTEAKAWEFWSKGVDEFLAAVQFRADLRTAFPESA